MSNNIAKLRIKDDIVKAEIIKSNEFGNRYLVLEGRFANKEITIRANAIEFYTLKEDKQHIKFTSKIEYNVSYERDYYNNSKNGIITDRTRSCTITITSNTEENCDKLMDSLESYLKENLSFTTHRACCSNAEEINDNKYEYFEYFSVDDKYEFKELKDLYKEWKKSYRD